MYTGDFSPTKRTFARSRSSAKYAQYASTVRCERFSTERSNICVSPLTPPAGIHTSSCRRSAATMLSVPPFIAPTITKSGPRLIGVVGGIGEIEGIVGAGRARGNADDGASAGAALSMIHRSATHGAGKSCGLGWRGNVTRDASGGSVSVHTARNSTTTPGAKSCSSAALTMFISSQWSKRCTTFVIVSKSRARGA